MAVRRGSSQISINDYPEHLNPFYEDDNHKNIRFWNISKRIGRSRSFSLSGLNEGFKGLRKSFRLKTRNKKTPESKSPSPVELRKPLDFSSRFDENGFVIPSNERYIYQGSSTPIPRTKYSCQFRDVNSGYATLSNRSHLNIKSQSMITSTPKRQLEYSVRSSQRPFALPGLTKTSYNEAKLKSEESKLNPFDDEESLQDSSIKSTDNSSQLSASRFGSLARKKRRAPLPPSQSVSTSSSPVLFRRNNDNDTEISLHESENEISLHISEDELSRESSHKKSLETSTCDEDADKNVQLNHIESTSKTTISYKIPDVTITEPEEEKANCDEIKKKEDEQEKNLDTIQYIIEQTLNLTRNDEEFIDSLNTKDIEIQETRTVAVEEKVTNEAEESVSLDQKEDSTVSEQKEDTFEIKLQTLLNGLEKESSEESKTDQETRTESTVSEQDCTVEEHQEKSNSETDPEISQTEQRVNTEENIEIRFIDETENLLTERPPNETKVIEIENTSEICDKKDNVSALYVSVDQNQKSSDTEKKSDESEDPSKSVTLNNNNVWVDDAYNNNIFKYDMKIRKSSLKSNTNENTISTAVERRQPDINCPNPIPKPRRSRLFNSPSKE